MECRCSGSCGLSEELCPDCASLYFVAECSQQVVLHSSILLLDFCTSISVLSVDKTRVFSQTSRNDLLGLAQNLAVMVRTFSWYNC